MFSKNKEEDRLVVSRLMDGEWTDINPSDSVVDLCNDEALKAKWERYHLIRDIIRDEPVDIDSTLSMRISSAIADEPTYSNVTSLSGDSVNSDSTQSNVTPIGAMPKWRTGFAGLGIAASVAMVTVVGMNSLDKNADGVSPANSNGQVAQVTPLIQDGEGVFSQQVPGAPLPQVEFVANTGAFWVASDSTERVAAEERLNMFLSQHIENSPTSVREGMLPYSRLVGYDEAVTSPSER